MDLRSDEQVINEKKIIIDERLYFLLEKHLGEFLKYLIAEKQTTFISELCQRDLSKGSFDHNNFLIKVI